MDEALRENREKWGWKCIMSIGQRILDEVYPADIFTGESGDLGPRYIVALREAIKAINETR
jgi:hypothetical protein